VAAGHGLVFAILDPPAGLGAAGIVDYVLNTAALGNLSEHAAIYWPRVKVLNPSRSVFGSSDQLAVAPSGIIAGVFSRTDGGRPGGVYDPPAGIDKGGCSACLASRPTRCSRSASATSSTRSASTR
jgi:hypothetical protein